MSNNFGKLCSVLMVLSVLCLTTNSQDFCESYVKNGHKVVFYSDSRSAEILLVINSAYWELQVINDELVFKKTDRKAINSSPLLSNKYRFAVKVWIKEREIRRKGIAFYDVISKYSLFYENLIFDLKPKNNIFDIVVYKDKTFNLVARNITPSGDRSLLERTAFGFSSFYRRALEIKDYGINLNGLDHVVLADQSFDEKTGNYRRFWNFMYDFNFTADTLPFEYMAPNQSFEAIMDKLVSFEMIGIYVKESIYMPEEEYIYSLFRSGSDPGKILYCFIKECKESQFQAFIHCSNSSNTIAATIVLITVMVAMVAVLLIALYIAYRRQQMDETSKRNTSSSGGSSQLNGNKSKSERNGVSTQTNRKFPKPKK